MTHRNNVVQLASATFDDWWLHQFHKQGKPLCKVKWDAITSSDGYHTRMMDKTTGQFVEIHLKATPEEILDGQKRANSEFFRMHGLTENTKEKNFVRRPQQWLNQGGWLDFD